MKAFIFFMIVFSSSPSWSDPITLVAVGDPWPVLLNPEEEQQGLIVEIARKALLTQGYNLTMEFVPWPRAIRMIKERQADFLIGAWYSKERNSYLLYSKPIFSSMVQFVKQKESTFEYHGLPSLKGKRIGTLANYQYDPNFLNDININRIMSDSLLNNINNLIVGRIDLTLDDHYVLKHTLDKNIDDWKSKLTLVDNPLVDKKIFITANRSDPKSEAIIKAFNLGLAQLKREGRYEKIIQSYSLEQY